jgi:hypothetical protein
MNETELVPNYDLIDGLAHGPDSQIDNKMRGILKGLRGKSVDEVKPRLHKALDIGTRYALASGFVMKILDLEWRRLGGSPDDPAPWREEIEKAGG